MTTSPPGIRRSTRSTNLDRHWAVKVVTPEDRATTVRYAMGVLTRLVHRRAAGRDRDAAGFRRSPRRRLRDRRERMARLRGSRIADGAALPRTARRSAPRTSRLGADRAFMLTAALPVDPAERVAALYRTLLLGRPRAARQQANRVPPLAEGVRIAALPAHRGRRALGSRAAATRRRAVDARAARRRSLGTRARDGDHRVDPRGASDARSGVLRHGRRRRRIGSASFSFTLFHLTEAATELLLFRVHGEPARVESAPVQPLHAGPRRRRR